MNKSIKILSTKTIADELVQQANAKGIVLDTINFIETRGVENIAVKEKIKQYADKKIAAIFTSSNAVEAVLSAINTVPDWTIFCTSGATKEALLEYITQNAIVDTAHNASALADKFLAHKELNSCVFFCGSQRLNTLPDKLLNQGINLDEVIVYETIAFAKKINEIYDGVLFFSPSAVESFFSLNKIAGKTVLFSIGKTTTKAIRNYTNNTIVTATFPGAESVIKEVKKFDFEV